MSFSTSVHLNNIDRQEWDDFIMNHPNGNIFQSSYFYDACSKTEKYSPVVISYKHDGMLSGILMAVVQKEYKGVLGKLSSRAIIYGGPIAKDNNPEIIRELVKKYNKAIEQKAIYSQFRNLFDTSVFKSILLDSGYTYEDHLDIIVDLTLSQEQLWKDIHSKRRNEIRRATREGTVFSLETSKKSLKCSYKILQEVYSRAKLPLPTISYFQNLHTTLNGSAKLLNFAAKYEDKIIGCMLVLAYKGMLFDFYAGSRMEYYNKYPNDLIPWEVFLWGKENGYQIFDFGGAGKPDKPYGVRDYKKKFGGEIVNYGRYEKIHNRFLFDIARSGFKFWQIIKP